MAANILFKYRVPIISIQKSINFRDLHSGYSVVLRFLAANRLVIAPLPQPPLVHPMARLVIKIWARAPPPVPHPLRQRTVYFEAHVCEAPFIYLQ